VKLRCAKFDEPPEREPSMRWPERLRDPDVPDRELNWRSMDDPLRPNEELLDGPRLPGRLLRPENCGPRLLGVLRMLGMELGPRLEPWERLSEDEVLPRMLGIEPRDIDGALPRDMD
jgi:hypothetical protein